MCHGYFAVYNQRYRGNDYLICYEKAHNIGHFRATGFWALRMEKLLKLNKYCRQIHFYCYNLLQPDAVQEAA
jgi:hypothetical protein